MYQGLELVNVDLCIETCSFIVLGIKLIHAVCITAQILKMKKINFYNDELEYESDLGEEST